MIYIFCVYRSAQGDSERNTSCFVTLISAYHVLTLTKIEQTELECQKTTNAPRHLICVRVQKKTNRPIKDRLASVSVNE